LLSPRRGIAATPNATGATDTTGARDAQIETMSHALVPFF
jgi:hypothetical protein